ncbi:hypothetical protein LJC31_02645 [Synergistaceae bacterium OttesenSCG-928-I11]|nr:hypothetical protein [Synergistaceae bacterium OttesenSCG-928-I11]
MQWTAETNKFVIAKGFVDARDAGSRSVYGAFVSASGYQKTLYFKEIFSNDPIDRALSWPELLATLNDESVQPPANSVLAHYRKEFHEFIDIQRLLEYGRGRMDAKEIERKISYFCSDALDLSAIIFLELTTVSEGDLRSLMPFLPEKFGGTEKKTEKKQDESDDSDDDDSQDTEEGEDEKEQSEIFLSCEPVLDPVSGVAISDLSVGDLIEAKLPETSSYYQFFTNKYPAFNGMIEGEITGIKVNEYDVAVVALKLADGISGALKLSEKVRIKRLATKEPFDPSESTRISVEIVFAILSVAVFLVVMGVLLYVID